MLFLTTKNFKVVELVSGESVINRANPIYFFFLRIDMIVNIDMMNS